MTVCRGILTCSGLEFMVIWIVVVFFVFYKITQFYIKNKNKKINYSTFGLLSLILTVISIFLAFFTSYHYLMLFFILLASAFSGISLASKNKGRTMSVISLILIVLLILFAFLSGY